MLPDWDYAGAVGLDAAADVDLARRTAGLDTQADRAEAAYDTLDQRRAGAPERLDLPSHDQPTYRLLIWMPTAPSACVVTRSNSARLTVPV
jgi:hypothetical protein